MNTAQLDDLISAVMRDEVVAWSPASGVDLEQAFVRRCEYHGIAALLTERWRHDQTEWPEPITAAIRQVARAQAIWELRHRHVLTQLTAALTESSILSILFKGTALAYDIYPNPVFRPRADTDMIVSERELARCREVLASQGFTKDIAIPGNLVSYQESWTFVDAEGAGHSIDLHRKINNSEILSRLFTYEELAAHAHPLPALCPGALAAGRVHALLLACMHRATHKHNPYYTHGIAHYGGNRLIWLYDIDLLATRLDPGQWDTFIHMAKVKGLSAICLEGLGLASSCFNTQFPNQVRAELAECPADGKVAVYLRGSSIYRQWMDFRAIHGPLNELRFIFQTIFPPADYMRWKYPNARVQWLPALYARRALAGIGKRVRNIRPR